MTDDQDSLLARVEFLIPLNKLPAERQSRLMQQSDVVKLKRKQTLFEQGERDDFTYYVLSGDIEMFADGSLIKRVSGGEAASFQPLAQLQPRQMSAVAKSRAEILRVKRSLLEQLLSMDDPGPDAVAETGVEVEEVETNQSGDWLMTLLQSELFTRIPPSNIQGLLDTLDTVTAEAGETIIKQGEPGDFYYAIQSGACEVVRSGANKREIKLADLQSGDTFGEEALISGAKRNATIRMTAAGELARLTKDDFTKLIKAPLLNSMTRAQAEEKVKGGALWLDVRFDDEHGHNGLPDSLNIPLSALRSRMDELDPEQSYVAYCDTGGRSSAAAFLLAEKGFDVCFIEGGAVAEPIPEKPAPQIPEKSAPAVPEEPTAATDDDALLAANARASALDAELEKARLTIDQAQSMMAEAETMKREAERIVAEKLAAERARMDDETQRLGEKLAEAQRLSESLATQKKAAENEVSKRQEEIEQRVKAAEESAQARLVEEERRLESLYQKQADQLESLQAEREAELREQISEDLNRTLQESERARLLKEEERREALEREQSAREAELREQLSSELAAERSKFEQQFLRTTTELERAKDERREALAAKEAATAEAQSVIADFKAQQAKLLAEQNENFEKERERLRAEAERIEAVRAEAVKAREAAQTAKLDAERALNEARERQANVAGATVSSVIDEIEQRASAADRDLKQALDAESAVVDAARENEDELERTYDTASEINLLLQKELDDWVGEQHDLQESTLQREVLSRQKEMVERIKARAAEIKSQTDDHNKSLLDEIEQQLGGN